VKTLSLQYTPDTLLHRFSTLAHRPWAMLLTSGHAEHADNRFDILTADPRVTLTTRGDSTAIDDGTGISHSNADPLQLVQQQLDALDQSAATQQLDLTARLEQTVGSDYDTLIGLIGQSKMSEFSLNASMMVFQSMQKMSLFNMTR